MAEFVHPTKFRHYLRKFSQGETSFPEIDIEETFKCRFQKMTGLIHTDVKNIYTEDFAEQSGLRIFIPEKDDLAYSASEISINLRWRSDECDSVQEWSDRFFNYVSGQKIEYHDTFRPNRYVQLILEKAPDVETEMLYSNPQYLIVKYTFKNWGGKIYSESQIK